MCSSDLARSYHACIDSRSQRVSLLVDSYQGRFWYWESVDLLRKFMQASVVSVVSPNTRVQIWFGLVIAVSAAVVFAAATPYRDAVCRKVQLAALLQVAFTYTAAMLFFEDPSQEAALLGFGGLDETTTGILLVLVSV